MSKARKKPPAGKRASRRKPNRSNHPFISRAEARRLAGRHVLKRMFQGAPVSDSARVRLNVYNVRQKDTWVVFKNSEEPFSFRSSEVLIVCKRTGRVLYEGSAGDEG